MLLFMLFYNNMAITMGHRCKLVVCVYVHSLITSDETWILFGELSSTVYHFQFMEHVLMGVALVTKCVIMANLTEWPKYQQSMYFSGI